MAVALAPDVVVYVCANCLPADSRLPRQWTQDGSRVVVHSVPCSGKMDAQYLFHAFEGGARGICVVACPKGECHLTQGNYRAEVRVRTVQRLLGEIGLECDRVELTHITSDESAARIEERVRESAARIIALGESPLRAR